MRNVLGRLLLPAILVLLAQPGAARAADACPQAHVPPLAVPQSRIALDRNKQLVIVALGSSSTVGWRASDIAHSYPAVLQRLLTAALPAAHVAVINRGIGGQDAPEEVARLDKDVLALRPQLVIWQVGANGALRDEPPGTFDRLVLEGVDRMHAAGADVVLMDNQRAPRILASMDHVQIERTLADAAKASGASLFSRGKLMDAWRAEGAPYARFIAADGLHQNDLGYRCVAAALANAILDGLHGDTASHVAGTQDRARQHVATTAR